MVAYAQSAKPGDFGRFAPRILALPALSPLPREIEDGFDDPLQLAQLPDTAGYVAWSS